MQAFERSDKFMKLSLRKNKSSSFIVFCLAAIVAIVACNLWSLYWGHCVLNDFLRIPLIGWGLIGANLVAALIFFAIKRRHKTKNDVPFCASCRTDLQDTWLYCPSCGDGQVG